MSNGVNLSAGPDFVLLRDEVTFDMGANDGNTINAFIDIVDDLMVEGKTSTKSGPPLGMSR